MHVAVVCTGLLGLLVFGLGLAVSLTRGRTATAIGHGTDPTDRLHKLVRAHGNAAEYAPMLAVLMLVLGSREPSRITLGVCVLVTVARYVHAAGMITGQSLKAVNPMRFLGALVTYLGGLVLAVTTVLA